MYSLQYPSNPDYNHKRPWDIPTVLPPPLPLSFSDSLEYFQNDDNHFFHFRYHIFKTFMLKVILPLTSKHFSSEAISQFNLSVCISVRLFVINAMGEILLSFVLYKIGCCFFCVEYTLYQKVYNLHGSSVCRSLYKRYNLLIKVS